MKPEKKPEKESTNTPNPESYCGSLSTIPDAEMPFQYSIFNTDRADRKYLEEVASDNNEEGKTLFKQILAHG